MEIGDHVAVRRGYWRVDYPPKYVGVIESFDRDNPGKILMAKVRVGPNPHEIGFYCVSELSLDITRSFATCPNCGYHPS